jgi:HrpA-like RNA helicase
MVVNASNLFYIRPEDREKADATRFKKFSDEEGDFFYLDNIYNQYARFRQGKENERMKQWAREHFLSLKTLRQVRELVTEIKEIIKLCRINEKHLGTELGAVKHKLL